MASSELNTGGDDVKKAAVDSLDYRRFDKLAAEFDSDEEEGRASGGAPDDEQPGPSGDQGGAGSSKQALSRDAAGNAVLDDADLPPLFWNSIPENADEHPDKIALDALMDEDTPEERADTLKRQGNEKLKFAQKTKQKLYYREAVQLYTQALEVRCSDQKLNAVLYSNRAQVNLTLGNNARALDDAKEAIALDGAAIKGYYRAARAALRVEKWDECRRLCEAGLMVDQEASELHEIAKEARVNEELKKEAEERARGSERRRRADAVSLAMAITGRGWRLGRPQFSVGTKSRPALDEEDMVHWPVLLMYAEVMTDDSIEDFHEAVTIQAQLDHMFGPDAPPLEWDEKREYTRDRVELYYLANSGKAMTEDQIIETFMGHSLEGFVDDGPKRLGTDAAEWVKVDESDALGEVLQRPDYVIPGIPVFFVVAKDTEFRRRLLANDKNLWRR